MSHLQLNYVFFCFKPRREPPTDMSFGAKRERSVLNPRGPYCVISISRQSIRRMIHLLYGPGITKRKIPTVLYTPIVSHFMADLEIR